MKQIELKHGEYEATALSREEYVKYRGLIPPVAGWWWLRSPHARYHLLVGAVDIDGWVSNNSVHGNNGARPALKSEILESSNLNPGETFCALCDRFIYLGDGLAICEGIVGKTRFGETNDYEKSDLKAFIEKWTREGEYDVYDE